MYYNDFNENDVRLLAHNYLIHHYRNSKIIGNIYSKTEAKTKEGKFADGFYAFRRTHKTIYTASLECKKTLKSGLKRTINTTRLIDAVFLLSTVLNISFFTLWFKYNKMSGIYIEPLTIVLIMILFLFLHSQFKKFFKKNTPKFLLTREVFLQLKSDYVENFIKLAHKRMFDFQ